MATSAGRCGSTSPRPRQTTNPRTICLARRRTNVLYALIRDNQPHLATRLTPNHRVGGLTSSLRVLSALMVGCLFPAGIGRFCATRAVRVCTDQNLRAGPACRYQRHLCVKNSERARRVLRGCRQHRELVLIAWNPSETTSYRFGTALPR
jgi:hypothetical protein